MSDISGRGVASRWVILSIASALWFVATGSAVAGQCNDPWVTQAVTKYLRRPPSGPNAPECNINLYRNGHWNNYGELDAAVDAYWATHPLPAESAPVPGVCGDPWVTNAIRQVTGRAPNGSGNSGECTIGRYGGGHWSSYDDLVGKVRVAFGMAQPQLNLGVKPSDFRVDSTALGYNRGVAPAPGRTITYQGRQYQVSQVIAQGGGNVIAQGGGNVIAQGGGNLTVILKMISSDGTSVVGPAGGSMRR